MIRPDILALTFVAAKKPQNWLLTK
jgi:hypothetical protein